MKKEKQVDVKGAGEGQPKGARFGLVWFGKHPARASVRPSGRKT